MFTKIVEKRELLGSEKREEKQRRKLSEQRGFYNTALGEMQKMNEPLFLILLWGGCQMCESDIQSQDRMLCSDLVTLKLE